MTTLNVNDKAKTALLSSIEISIDILNDTAPEPMWFTPAEIRELAQKTDIEIREIMGKKSAEVDKNIEQLIELQILRLELLSK